MLPINCCNVRRVMFCLLLMFVLGCTQTLAPMSQRELPRGKSAPQKTKTTTLKNTRVKTTRIQKNKRIKRSKRTIIKAPSHHIVKSGDTLHSIAWRYGLDFENISKWNLLKPPYVIKKGQLLALRFMPKAAKEKKIIRKVVQKIARLPDPPVAKKQKKMRNPLKVFWGWPTQGEVIQSFNRKNTRKGLGIAGREGQPIVAAADGEVVYSDNSLRGYGNLVIINHGDSLLSAYAHNKTLVVTERDQIRKGQQIATMGIAGDKAILYFEIRKFGEPVNPLSFLPDR